jgi:hypothetical protein
MCKSDNPMWIVTLEGGERCGIVGRNFNARRHRVHPRQLHADVFRGRPAPRSSALIVEALLSYFVLFSIGFSNLYNFVLHVFFGKLAASFIGWEDSPFQLEVGFASLGFAVVGLLAFRGSFDLRLAAIVGPAGFLWGAAAGHVYQMITAHNFAPGNAGVIFYSDILVPVVGFIFLWLQHRAASSQQVR